MVFFIAVKKFGWIEKKNVSQNESDCNYISCLCYSTGSDCKWKLPLLSTFIIKEYEIFGKIQEKMIEEILDEIAENAEIINDIFEPSKNGCLGEGTVGLTYKGMFSWNVFH